MDSTTHDLSRVLIELGLIVVSLAILARIASRWGFSAIPLYLLAGLAFGKGGLAPLNLSAGFTHIGAEIGVLLLLFMLGLQYTGHELVTNLRSAFPAAIIDLALNFTPGLIAGLLLQWQPLAAVLLGGVTYVSSSGVIAKVLADLRRLENPETPAVLFILVLEDLAMAVYLPLVAVLLAGGGSTKIALSVSLAIGTVSLVLLVAVRYGQPLSRFAAHESNDWRKVKPVAGKLFIVGDPKQAIYRFRRADVGTYEEVKHLLLKNGAELLQLTTSFRSLPSIQAMINRAFKPHMDGDAEKLQATYVPLSPFRDEYGEQPTVVVLPVPRPYRQKFSMQAVDESLPDAIAAFIAWLIEKSGWTVPKRGRPGERTAISPNDVCLLFRRFISRDDDMARPYVRALEARNLQHLLVGGKSFHDREEVQTIRSALTAIEWPDDELSVFATLKGSLFALRDDVLLEYRQRVGGFHPFRLPSELPGGELQDVADSLSILQMLHRNRNYRPVAETLEMLLRETRAHLAFALRPSGEQVLANVLHIAELARKYEASGGLSFRGFVEELRAGGDAVETGEAPIFEEGSEGIRMMSVHKAKGLERSE